MQYVYILKSQDDPDKHYTGITSNLKSRLQQHNAGEIFHTKKFRPWLLETYVAFSDSQKAIDFEKYLKSGSGRAFTKKRL